MIKKYLCLVCCLCIFVMCFAGCGNDGSSGSYTAAPGDELKFEDCPGGVKLTGFDKTIIDQNGVLNIPGEYEGKAVVCIGELAFAGCSDFNSVVFPESLAEIEKQAFRNCANLETLDFPQSLTSAGILVS